MLIGDPVCPEKNVVVLLYQEALMPSKTESIHIILRKIQTLLCTMIIITSAKKYELQNGRAAQGMEATTNLEDIPGSISHVLGSDGGRVTRG